MPKSNNSQKAKYWDAIDTTRFVGVMYSKIINPFLVPISGLTYQWPRSGNNYFITALLYKPNTPQTGRGYPRNLLKDTLHAGKTYCVKFYCNITNNSTYGVGGLGAYFGDNSTDTIHYCMTPISYLYQFDLLNSPNFRNKSVFIIANINYLFSSDYFYCFCNK